MYDPVIILDKCIHKIDNNIISWLSIKSTKKFTILKYINNLKIHLVHKYTPPLRLCVINPLINPNL